LYKTTTVPRKVQRVTMKLQYPFKCYGRARVEYTDKSKAIL